MKETEEIRIRTARETENSGRNFSLSQSSATFTCTVVEDIPEKFVKSEKRKHTRTRKSNHEKEKRTKTPRGKSVQPEKDLGSFRTSRGTK